MSRIVIDVSEFNPNFNVKKALEKGFDLIIRCGYGDNYVNQDDKEFQNNLNKCNDCKFKPRFYHTVYCKNENQIISESQHIIRLLPKNSELLLDLEYSYVMSNTSDWLKKVYYGIKNYVEYNSTIKVIGLYTSESAYLSKLSFLPKSIIWVAKYPLNDNGTKQNTVSGNYLGFQYTSKYYDSELCENNTVDVSEFYDNRNTTNTVDENISVNYKVGLTNGVILPYVNTSGDDYAGRLKFDVAIDRLYFDNNNFGDMFSQVKLLGSQNYLSVRKNMEGDGFAGIKGKLIDSVKVWTNIPHTDTMYRVYIKNYGWLPWIRGYKHNQTTSDSYAGIYNYPIYAIQIKLI